MWEGRERSRIRRISVHDVWRRLWPGSTPTCPTHSRRGGIAPFGFSSPSSSCCCSSGSCCPALEVARWVHLRRQRFQTEFPRNCRDSAVAISSRAMCRPTIRSVEAAYHFGALLVLEPYEIPAEAVPGRISRLRNRATTVPPQSESDSCARARGSARAAPPASAAARSGNHR